MFVASEEASDHVKYRSVIVFMELRPGEVERLE
jgi:hypothetical protein